MGIRHRAALTGRVLIIVLAAFASANANAVPDEVLAELPDIDSVAISPNGQSLAYFRPHNGELHLAIDDFSAGGGSVLIPPIEGMTLKWARWANDDRLVFALDFKSKRGFEETDETRLVAINKDGTGIEAIIRSATRVEIGSRIGADLPPPLVQDDIVDWLPGDRENILVSLDADHDERSEVRRINIYTGEYEIVQNDLPGIQNHLADNSGQIRFSWGTRRDRSVARYRGADGEWVDASTRDWWQAGFRPLALDAGSDIAFVQGPDEHGRPCIRRTNLLSGEVLETIFDAETDEDSRILFDPANRQAIGIAHGSERPNDRYFDENMIVLKRTIDSALPDATNLIVSMSVDRRQLIVYADRGPGQGVFYFWDRDAKSIELIGKKNNGLPLLSEVNN